MQLRMKTYLSLPLADCWHLPPLLLLLRLPLLLLLLCLQLLAAGCWVLGACCLLCAALTKQTNLQTLLNPDCVLTDLVPPSALCA